MKNKRQKPQPPTEKSIKEAYKMYLSKDFTLKQITRYTKVSSYWIYKYHKNKLNEAKKMQLLLF